MLPLGPIFVVVEAVVVVTVGVDADETIVAAVKQNNPKQTSQLLPLVLIFVVVVKQTNKHL